MLKWMIIPDLRTHSSSSVSLPTQLTSGKCVILVHLMQKPSFYFAYRKLAETKIRLKMELIPQNWIRYTFYCQTLACLFYIF